MATHDLGDTVTVVTAERAQPVATDERQGLEAEQLVPQVFEAKRSASLAVAPQQLNELAERADLAVLLREGVDLFSDDPVELAGRGQAVAHEVRQHLLGIEAEVAARGARAVHRSPIRA